jgi:hypothetical protein
MDRADRVLYHQVHPLKLASDGTAELVSLPLIWRGRYRLGLAVHLLPPIAASALVMRRTADLERIRDSSVGRYVRVEMTGSMQAVRLLGDAVTVVGAWSHRRPLIGLGALIVVAGWTMGPGGVARRRGRVSLPRMHAVASPAPDPRMAPGH